jgi:hypothetical protein
MDPEATRVPSWEEPVSKRTPRQGFAPTRREFGKALAVLAAAPLAAQPGTAKADEPKPPPARDALAAAADALTEVVRVRHGKHLTEEQLRQVRSGILSQLRNGEALKQVKLKNDEEPAFTFSADLP